MKEKAILLLFIWFLSTASAILAEEPVYFADANLKAAVEEALGYSDPTPTNMLGLVSIEAAGKGISDLTGLEYAANLHVLYLSYNQISDISPISWLQGLRRLHLEKNQISDISGLSGITNLWDVYLMNNQISELPDLSQLKKLSSLYLNGNNISNMS